MKYKSLIILLLLVIVWSLFFAIFKYFVWGIFKTDVVTLQFLSWYISVWGLVAYIIWGFLYEIFREKKLHFLSAVFALVMFSLLLFVGTSNEHLGFVLAWVSVGVGLFYGLWVVLKNVLIASYIHESGISDTKVNGMANIFFITSIIVGSILGGIIAESLHIMGVWVGIILLLGALILGRFLKDSNGDKVNIKDKMEQYKQTFFADFLFILKRYFAIMLFASVLLTIATILSQKAIEYSVEHLHKTGSESAILLLYSALGAIVWNMISMKIQNHRWVYFWIFGLGFSVCAFLFPSFVDNFSHTIVLVILAGFFFWVSYNLIESYFFKKIADDNKKSYGSASLWIISSLTISWLMFLVDTIQNLTSFHGVYYFMGVLIFWIASWMYLKKNTYNS